MKGKQDKKELVISDRMRSDIAAILNRIPVDFGGGCSLDKSCLLAWLIRRFELKTTLDIGVYRGRSLFPQALVHHRYTGGVVYGVDPWSASEAKQYDNFALWKRINKFVEETDFQAIYEQVRSMRNSLSYEKHCLLLRRTSADAVFFFRKNGIFFDLIHIDGNHDTEKVTRDVDLYLPRLKRNGFVVLDDTTWESIRPACRILGDKLQVVYEWTDKANDYAVFWNSSSSDAAASLRIILARLNG